MQINIVKSFQPEEILCLFEQYFGITYEDRPSCYWCLCLLKETKVGCIELTFIHIKFNTYRPLKLLAMNWNRWTERISRIKTRIKIQMAMMCDLCSITTPNKTNLYAYLNATGGKMNKNQNDNEEANRPLCHLYNTRMCCRTQ